MWNSAIVVRRKQSKNIFEAPTVALALRLPGDHRPWESVTFAENFPDMNEYTFEMVPGLVGRIAELLESIDSKLDKVNVAPIPTDDTPELMNVKDLGRYLPSHPAPSTVYSWVNDNTIPYYKQGKTLMFKKSEIDKWLLRTRVKDNTELMEEAQRYCATHPIGSRRR